MPDLSLLQIIAQELGISVSELLNGRHMSEEELFALRGSINAVIEMKEADKDMKKKKLNNYLVACILCFVVVLLNHQFGILSLIFRENISEFVAGALTGLALLLEMIGIYNNNHDKTFKQRKKEFFSKEAIH